MKNLQIWHVSTRKLEYVTEEINVACYGHHGTNKVGELFVCTNNLIVRCFGEDGSLKWSKDLSEFSSLRNSPINIRYLNIIDLLSVGLANGEIFGMTATGANCELKGICEDGLLAMEWSYDQEVLALVNKSYQVIIMSSIYDTVNQVDLFSEEFGSKEFITVGWGKKETQFHGSEGKQAAKAKSDFFVDKHAILNNQVLITWKFHGTSFAVGFTMEGVRRFKVFDTDGKLLYTSEKLQGLESNLAWKPTTNLITTTQRYPDKHVVAFFENNGLKHREFELPNAENIEVESILFSQDSDILTLVCKDLKNNSPKVLLYVTCNYHWYLKQVLSFTGHPKISKILWDYDFNIVNNKKLYILFKNGTFYTYYWIWDVNHSVGRCKRDDAVVAVIDGKNVLVSSFRHTAIPPPMANLEIETNHYVDSVVFLRDPVDEKDHNSFLIFSSNKLILHQVMKNKPLQYNPVRTYELAEFALPLQSYNWHWWKKNKLLCIEIDKDSNYYLVEYLLTEDSIKKVNIKCLNEAVLRIQSNPSLPQAFLQMISGKIIEYSSMDLIEGNNAFPNTCPKFYVLVMDKQTYFIGLTIKGVLYLNNKPLMYTVTSIFIHTDFFLITSSKNYLLCTKLTHEGINSLKDYDQIESPNVYKRQIERSARIIVAVPNSTKIVFQMFRGNIEVIEPRPLSLKIIGEHLDSLNYNEAFKLMRKQRINLNLLYDHNPNLFVQNIDVFLQSIQNNSWLSLFLTDIENDDVTKTMYAINYSDNVVNEQCDNKINFICELVRERLNESKEKSSKILPLLTTYVKKNTENDLESALLIIKELKAQELDGIKIPVSSDEALKYLLYMVDVNKLFDISLGMYDFDLVLLVANKSQKDPKEYIPMLNELNLMEENYKRFTINKNLKNYVKAVESLIQCGAKRHEELKTFVKYHSLYKEAITMLSKDEVVYKEICDDFGSYLKLKKRYLEAGIMFERADNIYKAIECYKEALEWEQAIKLAQQMTTDEFKEICWDFVNLLKIENRHKEAIRILEILNDDQMQVINYAIENNQFKTAIRLCYVYDMHHYLEAEILPSLIDNYNNLKDLIQSNAETFKSYVVRLDILRQNKKKIQLEIENVPYYKRDYDLYSDVGSTVGSSTGSSRSLRSSKNRRKQERKVASLKEGSQYEDIALVMALHALVSSTFELRQDVREVNVALLSLHKDEEARLLQFILDNILQEMKENFKQIWSHDLLMESTKTAIEAERLISEGCNAGRLGIAVLETHFRIAPVIKHVNWKLDTN